MRVSRQLLATVALGYGILGYAVIEPARAFAQDHPVFLPTRDVSVTYQLTSGNSPPQITHLYYAAGADKLRIDTPENGGFTVMDRAGHQRLMVMNQDHAYAAMPLDPADADGFVLNSKMTFQRTGQDTVAGVACTVWTVTSQQTSGTACVTPDGVLLRGGGKGPDGSQTGLVATAVDYATQPTTLFEPPADFHKLDPSQMQPPPGTQDGEGPGPGGPGGPPPDGPGPGQ